VFNVGSVQGYLKLNTTGWTTGIKSARTSLQTLSRLSTRMGAAMLANITVITREYGKFDKAIRHATSVSETTEAQFKAMSAMALDASVRWNKAAVDTAQAFYYLGSAGLTVTEQMAAFNDTIMLSRAMGSELSQTVEGMVDIVRAFGLEFADSRHIADQLTKTIITSNQVFMDLDRAMSYAASTAHMTNNTLAETAAMLGVMANAGIKGSMAGTVFRRALANLMAPMGAMRELIYELGLDIYDTTGKMRPFVEIMGQISDRIAGTTDEYKNLVFRTLFGVRAIGGQIRLFDYGSEAIKRYAAEIENAGGTTEKVAKKQMAALTEQAGRLWRQIQKLAIMLGEQLAPAWKLVVDRLMEHAKAMEDYVTENAEAIASTLKWVAIIGALALAIPIVVSTASAILSLINPFTVVLTAIYLYRAVWEDTFKSGGVLNKSLDEFATVLRDWADEQLGIFDEVLGIFYRGVSIPLKGAAMLPRILPEVGEYLLTESKRFLNMLGITQIPLQPYSLLKKPEKTTFDDVIKKGEKAAKTLLEIAAARAKIDIEGLLAAITPYIPPDLQGVIDQIKEIIDLIMREPIKPTIDEVTDSVEELGKVTNTTAENSRKAVVKLAFEWKMAIREIFKPSIEDMDKWQDKFVRALTDIRSQWATTFENMLNTGGNFKDFMEEMFLGILRAFNRMVAEIAAQDLLYALTGKKYKRTEGMPTIWDLVPSFIKNIFERKTPETVSYDAYTHPISGTQEEPWMGVPKIAINVNNNTSQPINLRETGRKFRGKDMIINMVMEEYRTNPNFRNAMNEK